MKGTHDRSGPKLPATGRTFEIRGVAVGQLSDGLVTRNTDYWNREGLLVELGFLPGRVVVGSHT
jgi:hypothetical protein